MYLQLVGRSGAERGRAGRRCSLPHALDPFRLPAPPAGEEAIRAVRSSLRTLDLAADRIRCLLASVYRACLAESDSSNHLAGPTGAGKSELAALAQQHGAGFTPATSRIVVGHRQRAGSARLHRPPRPLRDRRLRPGRVANRRAPIGAKADRVLRGQGNRSGRQRMRADTTLRPIKRPRGQIVSTGEDTPRAGLAPRPWCWNSAQES